MGIFILCFFVELHEIEFEEVLTNRDHTVTNQLDRDSLEIRSNWIIHAKNQGLIVEIEE